MAAEGKNVVIVGGGIAGLYCARELAAKGWHVDVLEATGRFGGRVETEDLRPGPDGGAEAFQAEFGPMRFELDIQPKLAKLLDQDYKIEHADFSPPTAARPPVEYPLDPDERGPRGTPLSALELLKLGVYRMFAKVLDLSPWVEEERKAGRWIAKVELTDDEKSRVNALSDLDGSFDDLRKTATEPTSGQPLHELGFWNALQMNLSPMAVSNVLHFGTFYHLMPDNPNAVEWGIFWLRLFQPGGEKLSTIKPGVERLTEALERDLDANPEVELWPDCPVVKVEPAGKRQVKVTVARNRAVLTADHVVLALPKQPLLELERGERVDAGRGEDRPPRFEQRVREDLDQVVAFPLLKVFCVTKTPPWWTKQREPQEGAWLAPTREVHYFPRGELKANTMILLYTDRPASAFWQEYVVNKTEHDKAEISKNDDDLKPALRKVLFEMHWTWAMSFVPPRECHSGQLAPHHVRGGGRGPALLDALSKFFRATVDASSDDPAYAELARQCPALVAGPEQVLFKSEQVWNDQLAWIGDYAIRDWARPPFGAGCHAWKPGAKSWQVRKRLAAFGFEGHEREKNLHVCGEAYSDYQGFIEGALRSAQDAVDAI